MTKYSSFALAALAVFGCGKSDINGSESHFIMCSESKPCETGSCDVTQGLCVDRGGQPIVASDTGALPVEDRNNDVESPDDADNVEEEPLNDSADDESPPLQQGGASSIPDEEPVEPVPSDVPELSWDYDGGERFGWSNYALRGEQMFMREASVFPPENDPFPYQCTRALGACPSNEKCAEAIHDLIQLPDVQAALSENPELLGCDSRPVDGVVLQIKVGEQELWVGSDCDTAPIPREISRLAETLREAELAHDAACIYQGPSEIRWRLDGGILSSRWQSTLKDGSAYVFQASSDAPGCSSELSCSGFGVCSREIEAVLADPSVSQALETGGLYGDDNRPVDGVVLIIEHFDGPELTLGDLCSNQPANEPCEDAALDELRNVLLSITERQAGLPCE
jgi:hypothetical protein